MQVWLAMGDIALAESLRRDMERHALPWEIETTADGAEILRVCAGGGAGAVLLAEPLRGLDGRAVLRRLAANPPVCPPRILFLDVVGGGGNGGQPRASSAPLPAPVDAVLPFRDAARAGEAAMRAVAGRLVPAMAALTQARRRAVIASLLDALGMPPLKGRDYAAWLLERIVPAPDALSGLSRALYPLCGQAFGARPAAVERCLRNAIEQTWTRGRLGAIDALFGLSVDPERGKPTNRAFLAAMSERARALTSPPPSPDS